MIHSGKCAIPRLNYAIPHFRYAIPQWEIENPRSKFVISTLNSLSLIKNIDKKAVRVQKVDVSQSSGKSQSLPR
jgi:hypothetical protein